MSFSKAAKILVIASIVILFSKSAWNSLPLKPDVFFILASACCTFIAIIRKEISVHWKNLLPPGIVLIIAVIAPALGSYMSSFLGYALPIKEIMLEYRVLAGCILIFVQILILGMHDRKFLTWVAYGFLSSLLIVITPYISIPSVHVLQGSNRFSGLIASDFYTTFMLLPTLLVFHFLVQGTHVLRTLPKNALLFLLLSLSFGLIIWSGTRSGWLGMTAGMLSYTFIAARNSDRRLATGAILVAVFAAASVFGYALMPANAKNDIKNRIGYITTAPVGTNIPSEIDAVAPIPKDNSIKTIPIIDAISHNQDRLSLWHQGIAYIKRNPLGYGLGYSEIINIDQSHSGVHSFPLELLLTGGIALFLAMLYLVGKSIASYAGYLRKNRVTDLEAVLCATLVGFVICTFFLSSLLIRWFWIDLALLVAWQMHRKEASISE